MLQLHTSHHLFKILPTITRNFVHRIVLTETLTPTETATILSPIKSKPVNGLKKKSAITTRRVVSRVIPPPLQFATFECFSVTGSGQTVITHVAATHVKRVASRRFVSCGLFGPCSPLIMPECWLTPSSPVVLTIAAASYTIPLLFTFVLFSWCWTLLPVSLSRGGNGTVSLRPFTGFWCDSV